MKNLFFILLAIVISSCNTRDTFNDNCIDNIIQTLDWEFYREVMKKNVEIIDNGLPTMVLTILC